MIKINSWNKIFMYGFYKLFFDVLLLYDILKLVVLNFIMKIKLCKFVLFFLYFDIFYVYVYLIKRMNMMYICLKMFI